MAAQHAHLGIRVNVVAPGSVQTPRVKGATEKLGTDLESVVRIARAALRLGRRTRGTGWDIGYAVLYFASDESSWVSGQVLTVDCGHTATLPAVVLAEVQLDDTTARSPVGRRVARIGSAGTVNRRRPRS